MQPLLGPKDFSHNSTTKTLTGRITSTATNFVVAITLLLPAGPVL